MDKWFVVSCAAVALWAGGCDCGVERGEEAEASVVGDEDEQAPVRSEHWPDAPGRVVSMAPNVTELLFELGVGERVVAVTRYCDWPKEVDALPTIGGMLDPDHEAMLAVEPDLVVGVKDGADHRVVERLDRAEVAYGFVAMDDLETIRRGILDLGRWFDREDEAKALLEEFDADVEAASTRVRANTEGERALMVFDREPLVAAGPATYGDELLEFAGFENAVEEGWGAYPVLDVEKLLALDPEVVIDVTVEVDEKVGEAYWERFNNLEAVRRDAVIRVDDPVMMRPGIRIPQALDELGRAVGAP